MSFDWHGYLYVAKELAGQQIETPNLEAKYRAAISRAYYAAFCTARNYIRDIDKDVAMPNDGSVHRYVIDKFKQSSNSKRANIGKDLLRLRDWRRQADYDDIFSKPDKISETAIMVAQLVLDNLHRLQQ